MVADRLRAAVAGLAAITPCAGYVETYATIIIGGLAGLICHLALRLKHFLRLDDALDVTVVHFVGGVLGTFLLGFSGDTRINSIGASGLLYGMAAAVICWGSRCWRSLLSSPSPSA